MAYDFHYTPTGTGVISGKEVLEQTEDAINDLGNTAISGVQEALDKAEQALTNSENAVDDAQTALNTANNAEGVAIQAQTDVGNLSGTVANIGNRVTTAEGNITNLQGRMTTAEGNITNLQGRMTTAETNIGNLQTAVSTAQATANSAQQTATTARQQSYVLRYSSSSVTDNSTIAYSTIDNTDNIKASDKIIDSDGKIFSIVSVDTANQTVTVGSALIDLALDANVVHTSGDETVAGFKTFENIRLTNSIRAIALDDQTADINDCYSSFAQPNSPKNGNVALYSCNRDTSTANITNLPVQKAFYLISITIRYLSNTPTVKQILFTRENIKYERFCNVGTWSNWVKDTDKFVTTDTAQTISGGKTFSEDIVINNSDTSQATKRLVITSSKVNLGDNNSDSWGISFNAGTSYVATINSEKSINSVQGLNFTVRTKDGNNNLISTSYRLRVYTDGSAYLIPSTTDSISFGSSGNKWKDVQTNLINGITPSSLGMPDIANKIDISGYITDLAGVGNEYTPPVNGWICVRSGNANKISILDVVTSIGNASISNTATYLTLMTPCVANRKVLINIICTSLDFAYFIPCLGNI